MPTNPLFDLVLAISTLIQRYLTQEDELNQDELDQLDNLLEDWEWIESHSETINQQLATEETHRIQNELLKLRRSLVNQGLARYRFRKEAQKTWNLYSEEPELNHPLDASKRTSLITRLVDSHKKRWLRFIRKRILRDPPVWQKFQLDFEEEQYAQNIEGRLKSVGWQTIHGALKKGLTLSLLSELSWRLTKTLVVALEELTKLTEQQLSGLVGEVTQIHGFLIQNWITTVRNCRGGLKEEGKLVHQWRIKELEEEERLKEIKRRGADAKFTEGSVVISDGERQQIDTFRKIRSRMEKKLTFRVVQYEAPNLMENYQKLRSITG